jgi:hypothetical protein
MADFCPECGANKPEDGCPECGVVVCDNEFHGSYAFSYREGQLEAALRELADAIEPFVSALNLHLCETTRLNDALNVARATVEGKGDTRVDDPNSWPEP